MTRIALLLVIALAAFAAASCTIVDPAYYQAIAPTDDDAGSDAGVAHVDGGQ